MFEQYFKEAVSAITADTALRQKLWSEIRTAYQEPGRHYHNLTHLDNLVTELEPLKNEVNDWPILILSIAYHDIVYNTLGKNNEAKSADLAYGRLTALGLPETSREKCRQQILATRGHELSDDADTNYFTDADLSILGCDSLSYERYAGQIRREYSFYPDLLYKPGRRKVLVKFLEMKSIFKTKHFRDKYEEQARTNLTAELKQLS